MIRLICIVIAVFICMWAFTDEPTEDPIMFIYQSTDTVIVYTCDEGREDPIITKHIKDNDGKHIYLYNGNCQVT